MNTINCIKNNFLILIFINSTKLDPQADCCVPRDTVIKTRPTSAEDGGERQPKTDQSLCKGGKVFRIIIIIIIIIVIIIIVIIIYLFRRKIFQYINMDRLTKIF